MTRKDWFVIAGVVLLAVSFLGLMIYFTEADTNRDCAEMAFAIKMETRRSFMGECEVKVPEGYWKNTNLYVSEMGIQYLNEVNTTE
jgi:hypothetical protein